MSKMFNRSSCQRTGPPDIVQTNLVATTDWAGFFKTNLTIFDLRAGQKHRTGPLRIGPGPVRLDATRANVNMLIYWFLEKNSERLKTGTVERLAWSSSTELFCWLQRSTWHSQKLLLALCISLVPTLQACGKPLAYKLNYYHSQSVTLKPARAETC